MRFPLNQKIKIGYSFGQWTFYNTAHRGQDYQANYWNLYAPEDGTATAYDDVGGGMWIFFQGVSGILWQMAHLSKRVKLGAVKEGELIGVTGNSGQYTTGAHLHLQTKRNGVLFDPETINYGVDMDLQSQINQLRTDATATDNQIKTSINQLRTDATQGDANLKKEIETLRQMIIGQGAGLSPEDSATLSKVRVAIEAVKNLFR